MKAAIDVLIAAAPQEFVDTVVDELRRAGLACHVQYAGNQKALADQLRCHAPDVIVCGDGAWSFDSETAWKLACDIRPDVPFIGIEDWLAPENGAASPGPNARAPIPTTPLRKLGPKVRRAVREARQQSKLRELELMVLTSRWPAR